MKFKSDKYKTGRGGRSKLLDISCQKCGEHILYYQKDGPGNLRRMYMDRIVEPVRLTKNQHLNIKEVNPLVCPGCKEILAHPIIYKKEKRNAYRCFVDGIIKKQIKSSDLE